MARILFVLFLSIHLSLGGGERVRTLPFREVLHGVAYKFSLDPEQSNFLTNQAIPIGTYIDEWVRRLYDSRDWPEWTITGKFAPASHVVTWDALQIGATTHSVKIGRVLKVFLIDPSTTDAPVDTAFTLTDAGIHCGYQHGTHVWIRYMMPPPKFTAVQWDTGTTYQLDDVAYSYTTGEVYRSKANSNIGHDPVSNFSVPPNPIIGHPPSLPPPIVDVTQEFIPDNPGIAERPETMTVYFTNLIMPPDPVDPPPSGAIYKIYIEDSAHNPLGNSFVTADGIVTINDIIDTSVTQLLAALGGTFTVTGNHTDKTVLISDASEFMNSSGAATSYKDTSGIDHPLRVKVEAFIPAFAAASGQPQISQITITDETTYHGATYELLVTDSAGVDHSVEYVSQIYDDSAQILQGIILAVETAALTDTFWAAVQLSFDPTGITLDVSVKDHVSVMLRPAPIGSGWWELVPFPKAIADAVMRGATADLNREWGQDSKADGQEQVVPQEAEIAAGDFTTMPSPPLTGQQAALSRYRAQ